MDTKTAGKKGAEKRWGTQDTKVSAVVAFLKQNGGKATWQEIYAAVGTHHVVDKKNTDWKAGIRGIVYREIREYGRTFKMVGKGIVGLR